MVWSSDYSDIEELDIPIVILPYQFEPLAIMNTQYKAEHSKTQCKAEQLHF